MYKCVAYPGSSLKEYIKALHFFQIHQQLLFSLVFSVSLVSTLSLSSFMLTGMLLSVFKLGMNSMSVLCNDQQYQFCCIS